MELFQNNIKNGSFPSMSDCVNAVKNYKSLHIRSPAQLKAWVVNQMNKTINNQLRGMYCNKVGYHVQLIGYCSLLD